MERHIARTAEQSTSEHGDEEASHTAEKGIAERTLEALLGTEGEAMVERARKIREAIEKEGGHLG